MKYAAILGFGVVGSGVAEVFSMNQKQMEERIGEAFTIKKILDIRDFPGNPFSHLLTKKEEDVFDDAEISVVMETIGGAGIAFEFTKKALSKGKSVITSNKELVAKHGVELMELAKKNGCVYLFEASVGGGIPIIRPLHRCLAGNQIMKIAGIVNGTTNYILSKMTKEGTAFADSLKSAQELGYAEQNPTADIEGIDAQRKLSILSSIAMDGRYVGPEEIHAEGISGVSEEDILYAKALGMKVKLLAVFSKVEENRCRCLVAPHLVENDCPLSVAEDVFNAILVSGNAVGDVMFYGHGAGKLATASAVVGDAIEAVLHDTAPAFIKEWHKEEEPVLLPYEAYPVKVLLRSEKELSESKIKELFPSVSFEKTHTEVPGEYSYILGKCGNLTEGIFSKAKEKIEGFKGFIRIY